MNTLSALQLLQEKTKAEVFLVGGFVRDYLMGRESEDYDIVVRGIPAKAIIKFLSRHGKCKTVNLSSSDFEMNIILFRGSDKREAQIRLPRRGKTQIPERRNTLKQDAKYRDFTVNALYLPINFKSKKDVIDPYNGAAAIKLKRINPITSAADCIEMSPSRMLRAISLAARTNFRISESLLTYIRSHAGLLRQVPSEIIRDEFNKIILSSKPSRYLRMLQKLGLLAYISPELDRCVGVKQDPAYHKYDVFTHLIYTCDNIEPDLTLRLAALLHDVGKPDTRKEIDGRVTFHKHEMVSVKLTRSFLSRLRYSNRTKEAVLSLVRMHMYHYTRKYTTSAVKRFIKRAGITEVDLENLEELPLFKLRAAERLGNGHKTNPRTQRQIDFENRIKEVFKRGGGLNIKDLEINGHILMEALDIKPGREVGELLKYLLDRVSSNKELNNRIDLLEIAIDYTKAKRKGKACEAEK